MKKIKVGIVGLGLIGSSILKGLFDKNDYELFVCSKSSYKDALKYTKNSSDDINIVKNTDIVFLCCDISKTLKKLNELNEILDKKTIVADVASVKKDLLNKEYNFDFILSHPMAGTEKTGFSAGKKDLFSGCRWLVEKENNILNNIITMLKATPVIVDMKHHDELTAQISHLPSIVSYLLFDTANNEAKAIAAGGFRDMTRLAQQSSSLVLNMFNNKENILKYFDIMIEKMDKLKKMSDKEKIEYFEKIAEKRKKMYDSSGKNIFKI